MYEVDEAEHRYEEPRTVSMSGLPRQRQVREKLTLDDLVALLSGIAKNVDLDGSNDDGAKNAGDVRIPVSVACEFIRSVLSESSTICTTDVVNSWFGHLVAVLDKQQNGQPRDYLANMRELKALLRHPPYFSSNLPNAGTTSFYGAFSVVGGEVKVVEPVGAADGNRTGDLAAFDGSQFRHIGYVEKGKQTFDPGEYGDLLGCAVFVVEPSKVKKTPNK
jgi:hypothetical protein